MFGLATILRPAPAPVPDPPPDPPASEVDIGELWMFVGDSQSDGRDTGVTKSHVEAFCRIWQDTPSLVALGPAAPYTGLTGNPLKNGESGRTLAGTRTYYDGRTSGTPNKTTISMLWFQESGNQLSDGGVQDTPAEFKALVKAFCIAAEANRAGVVIVAETPFSFGRENETGRDWTLFRIALLEAAEELLAEEDITVYVVDTDAIVKRLQTAIGAANVWFQTGETAAYHYKAAGNLVIALGGYHALGYDIEDVVLTGITTVSSDWKTACIAAVLG